MRAWNLLQYPALAQGRRQRHRIRTSAAGCLLGVVLSWSGAQWLDHQHQRLRAELAEGQVRLDEAKDRTKKWLDRERQQQAWERQWQPLLHVLHEQQTWSAWLEALQQEAPRGSWQLLRLQQESGHMALQGISPDVRRLGLARERLAAQLRLDLPFRPGSDPNQASAPPVPELKLHSVNLLSSGSLWSGQSDWGGEAVEFVLHAPWPELSVKNPAGGGLHALPSPGAKP